MRPSKDSIRVRNVGSFAYRIAAKKRLSRGESPHISPMKRQINFRKLLKMAESATVVLSVRRWKDSKACASDKNSVSTNNELCRIVPKIRLSNGRNSSGVENHATIAVASCEPFDRTQIGK